MLRRRGQSSLEYVIVLTAIIAAVIAGAAVIAQKNTTAGLGKLLDQSTGRITDATGRLPGVPVVDGTPDEGTGG